VASASVLMAAMVVRRSAHRAGRMARA